MTAQIQQLTNAIASPTRPMVPLPSAPAPSSLWSAPERYDGVCNLLVNSCSILFALQPHRFSSEEAKVAFAINHLMGRAHLRGTAEWRDGPLPVAPSSPLSQSTARC